MKRFQTASVAALVVVALAILAVTSAGASVAPKKGGRHYQQVSLSKLLTRHERQTPNAQKGTTVIGGQLFRYAYHGRTVIDARTRIVNFNHTSCKSIDLDFAFKGGDRLTASILREGSSTISTNLGDGETGSLHAHLKPGKAAAVRIVVKHPGIYDADVYANGTASCYTRNGKA